jgi:aryl-alcohol dehydrogenase-like predicted oxidoreductase
MPTISHMEKRRFGDSELEVSAIAFGCWIVGVDWWGHHSDADGIRLMKHAYDCGISFFDTGDAYGNGRSERVTGEFVGSVGRDKVQIGSKFGYDFYSDPGEAGSYHERKQDFSPQFLRKALEESLKRLGTDYLDLYMAHNIKLPQYRDDLFAELEKLKAEGKVKVWGVSLGPAIGWREEGFEAMLKYNAQAVQTVFNLFEQHPGREFCELAISQHAGMLARVHDDRSILKGAVRLDSDSEPAWKVFGLKKLERVRKYADAHGMTTHQLACKWLLQQRGLTSITATLLNEQEITEAAESVAKPGLTQAELNEIAQDYAKDWHLGQEAHPCNLKSSVTPRGEVRSSYVPPPVIIA